MEEAATAGPNKESPARKAPPNLEDIEELKKCLKEKLDPLLRQDMKLRETQREEEEQLAALRERLQNTGDEDEKEMFEIQIQHIVDILETVTLLIELSEDRIAAVKDKYRPAMYQWELQVLDRVRARIPPENVAKYDKISKRLKAMAEKLESRQLSKSFSSLCSHPELLKGSYQKSSEIFKPIESKLPEDAFKRFCEFLYHFLERLPISSIDGEAVRSLLIMPFFVCGLDGMDAQFHLDVEVSVTDEFSQLDGKADIVIYCGNVEIVVIEERRGTSDQDPPWSVIPLALVEMDCLAKKRLSVKRPDFQLNKDVSFGVVTDCIRWYFLKLDIDGTYSLSERYVLHRTIVGAKSESDLSLLRGICMRIRGLVEEATK